MKYEQIVETLAKKYNISEIACERIINSEFKLLVETIQARDTKTVNLIKLGKFTPIKARIKYADRFVKKDEDKSNSNNSDNRGSSQETI